LFVIDRRKDLGYSSFAVLKTLETEVNAKVFLDNLIIVGYHRMVREAIYFPWRYGHTLALKVTFDHPPRHHLVYSSFSRVTPFSKTPTI
jgi:hypothetical protein